MILDMKAINTNQYARLLVATLLCLCPCQLSRGQDATKGPVKGDADSLVTFPFHQISKKLLPTGDYVLKGTDLKSYPSTDLRNAFVGLVSGLDVVEKDGSPMTSVLENAASGASSEKVSMVMRGYHPIFIVDGLQVDVSEMPLDPDEIESVTIIKDIVSKTLYGPNAGDGVINITTKRGMIGKQRVSVNVESGVDIVDRFPEWVGGADYARLNNMARQNSGMAPLYSQEDIAQFSKNDPYDLYHPNIDFRSMLWKDSRTFTRANVSCAGGNNWVRYFAYLGMNREGDNFKIGPAANSTRINARSNLDVDITRNLKVSLGIYGGLVLRNAPTYGSSVSNIDMESMLGSMTTIPSIAFPVYAYHEEGSRPWYGVSSTYSRNPIGDLEACGYYLEQTRSGAANIALDYDFKEFVPGLRFKTFLTFNSLNMTRIGKDNDYMAYIVSPPAAGSEDPVLIKVRDGVDNADQSKLKDYYYQRVALHEKLSYDAVFGDHALQAALVYSLSNGLKVSRREPERQQNGILSVLYSFKDRYSFEGVMNYAGTASFEVGKRYRLFPAAGIGWVVSEEPFMKDRLPFVNFLKLYANAGILGYDGLATAFYYQDRWSTASASSFGPHTANQWFGSNTESVSKTYPNRIANSNLTWEERREMALGMDALLFGERVSFGLNLYNNVQDGVIAKMSYMLPYLTGYSSASPWVNYDIYRYRGLEMKLAYSNQINHFKYSVGGNVSFYKSEVLKYDEPNYRESYRSKIGKSKNAIPGYTYIGRYASDEEAMSVTQFFDSNLAAGDLKYQDLNNDGIIDANDISFIGNSYPKIIYGVNVNLAYRNLGLKIIGAGRACFDLQKSNIYFRNGTGDNNYSKYVLENIGEGYPRLTYNRVANNFQTSAFWLERGDFFKIQNVELSYKLPLSKAKGIQGMKFLLRGANLLTISGVKDVDPESVDSGVTRYPLFRTFTGGMEISF